MQKVEIDLTTLQEVYFDLCDLIDSGQFFEMPLEEGVLIEFHSVQEALEELRDKLHPYTITPEETDASDS